MLGKLHHLQSKQHSQDCFLSYPVGHHKGFPMSAFGARYKEHTIRGGPEPRWILTSSYLIKECIL